MSEVLAVTSLNCGGLLSAFQMTVTLLHLPLHTQIAPLVYRTINTRQCNVMGSGLCAADIRFCIIQFLMEIFVFHIMKTVTVIKRNCKIVNSICQFITESFRGHLKVWNFYILSHATPEKLGPPGASHICDFYVWCVYCASGTDLLLELSGVCVNHWHRLYAILAAFM